MTIYTYIHICMHVYIYIYIYTPRWSDCFGCAALRELYPNGPLDPSQYLATASQSLIMRLHLCAEVHACM